MPLQFRVGEAHAGRRAQIHRSHFAAIQQQRELLALRLLLARGFDAPPHNYSGHGFAAEFQLDARALQLIERPAQRLPVADLKRELRQLMAQRVHRIVTQPADLSAAAVLHGERFQHVVHLAGIKIEPRRFARSQRPSALKESHPVFVENHGSHRQFGRQPQNRGKKQQNTATSHEQPSFRRVADRQTRGPSSYSPIALMMTRFGRCPSNSA